ncbi:hypothetical protein HHK36_028833 [Tetracentron sinense]|uniref:Glucose-methanol-choline oxidoreductase N-terminal domain-containing protein n=1 Tax=Tetracentron sinense TaxID=13715 RepID=A0A834YD60_TETSI|nr:hypothetical protein HHK36_028833 [Tetracentron sinense]
MLIERGGSPYGNQNISNIGSFAATLSDLSPTSPSQRFISEDGVINARGRVLGGGSCLNAGFYTRAETDFVQEAGWDGHLVNQSYLWVEKLVAFKPPMLQWQSAFRDGLLEVGILPNNGFTYDHIIGTKVGGTIFDRDGHRHTAADLLEYSNPKKLSVLLHATSSFYNHDYLYYTGRTRPVSQGVIFRDASGIKHRAYLKKSSKNEIIISAGAMGSPQLLMLSGVGPVEHLKSHNIKVIVNQPMVGQGMSDNPMNAIFIPSPLPVEISLVQVVGITRFGSYIEGASGANFAASQDPQRDFGMFSSQTGQLSTVPPKQRTPEAIAKAVETMNNLDDGDFRGGFILEKVISPSSTGHLELRNRNPDDNPSVTFNYFKEPEDLKSCVDGLTAIEKVVESKAFSKFRVVDRDYKVLGVDALRVIDGSTFNHSPGTNPQATVMMLGRYMGVRILNERLAMERPLSINKD